MSMKVIAHLVKPKRRRNGRVRTGKFFRIRWKFAGERRYHEEPIGIVDRQVADKRLMDFRREKESEAAGIVAPKPLRDAAVTSMSVHLQEFLDDRRARGRDERYVYNLNLRLTRLLDECQWKLPRDVSAESFAAWRSSHPKLSAKTLNDYLDAAVAMLRWMQQRGRIIACPLVKALLRVDGREVEKKVQRRALTDDEARRLLEHAGKHRAGRYKPVLLAALLTGLRWSELKGLRWGDVHLDALRAFWTARATTTKNGKPAAFMLRDDLVEELRKIRPGRVDETAAVFEWVPDYRTFRRLLKAAKVDRLDKLKRKVDFHALRKTYNTNLHRAGVSEAVHMQLMRVTDRRLIDKTYLDASQLPILDALDRLPRYEPQVAVAIAAATGTDGPKQVHTKRHTRDTGKGTQAVVNGCPGVSSSVPIAVATTNANRPESPGDCARLSSVVLGKSSSQKMRLTGVEPARLVDTRT